jgi:hypothetical protein
MATLMAELSRDNILKGFVWVLSRGINATFYNAIVFRGNDKD